jgi:hypothetical protein
MSSKGAFRDGAAGGGTGAEHGRPALRRQAGATGAAGLSDEGVEMARMRGGTRGKSRPSWAATVPVLVGLCAGCAGPGSSLDEQQPGFTYRLDDGRESPTDTLSEPPDRRPLTLKDLAKDPENIPDARRRGLRNYRDERPPEPGLAVPSDAVPELRQEQRRIEGAIGTLNRRIDDGPGRSPAIERAQERGRRADPDARLRLERRALEGRAEQIERDLDTLDNEQRRDPGGAGPRASPVETQLERLRQR